MSNTTLVILDLNKNYDLSEKQVKFISLNKGLINLENCEQIYLKNFNQGRKTIYKKVISTFLKVILKNKDKKIPLIELEVNNLRNDRYQFVDRIINLIIIKKIISKGNFKKIKIISDNKSTLNIFDKLNIEIEKIDFSKNQFQLNFFRLRLLKFYLKSLVLVFFLKFKENYAFKEKSEIFFSIYPNKFDYHKNDLDKEFFFNFLLTDETHLNHNIFEIFDIIKKKQLVNSINIESLISIRYLLCLIFKIFFFRIKFDFRFDEFKIDNLNFEKEIKNLYLETYLNRLKLSIYDHAIHMLFKRFNIKIVHMYLFEYNFGFYLINRIRNFSKKIKIIGYQHGIFSKNLMWLDILKLIKNKRNYLPNKIIASNIYSAIDYKEKLNIIPVIKNNINEVKKHNFVKEIKVNKKSNNIIILPGIHDIRDLYYFFKNLKKTSKKFFFKVHPKNRFLLKNTKNINIITSHKSKNFSRIIISQTSSLVYDFLKMKKKFFVVDIDYKSNLLNNRILKKIDSLSKKNL